MRHLLIFLLLMVLMGCSVTDGEPARKARVQALLKQLAGESLENRQATFDELQETVRKRDLPELWKESDRDDAPDEILDIYMLVDIGWRLPPGKGWTFSRSEYIRCWEKAFQDLGCKAKVSLVGEYDALCLDVRVNPEKWKEAIGLIRFFKPECLSLRGSLTDITFPGTLPSVESLNLELPGVTDLTPLKGMPYLGSLDLRGTQVTDLKGVPRLWSLNLANTQVADLTPLKGMPYLRELHLENTKVTDLTPLKGMSYIERLYLSNTQVTDLTPLKGMRNLRELHLENTKVTDLTPLKGMPNLRIFTLPVSNRTGKNESGE